MAVNEERIPRTFFGLGASAGGIEAIVAILDRLPSSLDATLAIVIHRSPTLASALVNILRRHSRLPLSEPEDGEVILTRHVYLAPRARHLLVDGGAWRITDGLPVHRWRPAVDPLLISAARHRGPHVAGVVLSGGGADGVAGLIETKRHGGICIAQDPRQALQASMPLAAIRYDDVDLVLRVEDIAAVIPALAAGEPVEQRDGTASPRVGPPVEPGR